MLILAKKNRYYISRSGRRYTVARPAKRIWPYIVLQWVLVALLVWVATKFQPGVQLGTTDQQYLFYFALLSITALSCAVTVSSLRWPVAVPVQLVLGIIALSLVSYVAIPSLSDVAVDFAVRWTLVALGASFVFTGLFKAWGREASSKALVVITIIAIAALFTWLNAWPFLLSPDFWV